LLGKQFFLVSAKHTYTPTLGKNITPILQNKETTEDKGDFIMKKISIFLLFLLIGTFIWAQGSKEEVIYVYSFFDSQLENYQPKDPKKQELFYKTFAEGNSKEERARADEVFGRKSFYNDPIFRIKPREYAGKIIIRGKELTTECMDPKLSQEIKEMYEIAYKYGIPYEVYIRDIEKPKKKYQDEEIIEADEGDPRFIRWYKRRIITKDDKEFYPLIRKMLPLTFELVGIDPKVGNKLIGDKCEIWDKNRQIYAAMQPFDVSESSLMVIEVRNEKTDEPEYFYYQKIPYFEKKYDFRPIKDILKDKNLSLDDRIEPFDIRKVKMITGETAEEYYKSRGLEFPDFSDEFIEEIEPLPEMPETFGPVNGHGGHWGGGNDNI
jgi:hypothetical protein